MPTSAAQWLGLIVLFVSSVIAIGLMIRVRVFQRTSVIGPARMPDASLAGGLLLTALIGFITMVAVTTVVVPLLSVATSPTTAPTTEPVTQPATAPTTQPMIASPAMAYVSVFAVTIAWMVSTTLLRMLHPDAMQWLGMRLVDLKDSAAKAVIAIAIILPFTFCSMFFFQFLYSILNLQTENEHQLLKLLRDSPQTLPVIVFSACILAPLFEELIFRGCVQSAVVAMLGRNPVAGRWIAVAISSTLFVLVHGELWMMPPLFVLAVGLGYAYERTGKLWVPILTHAAFNTVSIVVFLLSQN